MPDRELRTSLRYPLRIDSVPMGDRGGAVGMSQAPGRHQPAGNWARDLDIDLQAIVNWGATDVVSLLEPAEYDQLRIAHLPGRVRRAGLAWHGLPVSNGAAPDARLLAPWAILGPSLVERLHRGGRVLVHCRGGYGRTGTVAAMLLLQAGACSDGAGAVAMVRAARPDTVETRAQEAFVHAWAALQRQ